MAYVDWMIRGPKIGGCNCNYGCPCEFNAPPTYGFCEGLEAMHIDEGRFGAVRLDGLRYAAYYHWPGPVHEGHGTVQGIVDARASEAQREALLTILSGKEQEPTTVFNIYGSTIEKELDPVFAPIEFEWDRKRMRGRFRVPGLLEFSAEPIRNPVTGAEYPAKIVLPTGFEFREFDMTSSTFKSTGGITFEHKGRYGAASYVAYGPYGLIEKLSQPNA
jgi:hypothetical protein